MSDSTTTVMWFRRDLRLADNPALLEACASDGVLPLFVLDPALWGPAGPSRRAYLAASLRALDASLRQRRASLSVVRGNPVRQVVLAARAVGASRVHIAADYGPYGHRRDAEVEQALAEHGIELVRTGSPYAVAPGRVTKPDGDPYKVYTPFSKAWSEHGWRAPVDAPTGAHWLALDDDRRDPGGRAARRAGAARGRRGRGAASAGGRTSTPGWRRTTPSATAPTSTPPRGCPCTSSGARSTRARCWPT